jgi:hypothetical protein
MNDQNNIKELEASLVDLHSSVARLIQVIQVNGHRLEDAELILNKLPMLDFYNDDLRRNIDSLRSSFND